jgi:hypothetical protein
MKKGAGRMKKRSTFYFVISGVIVLIGLISLPFLPDIQAALLAGNGSSVLYLHSHTDTQKTPVKAVILAQDTFQRTDSVFWGTASDGLVWGADANSSLNFAITTRSGQVVDGTSVYSAVLGPVATDAEVVFSGLVNTFDHANMGAILHWQNTGNWYKAYIDGGQLALLKDTHGVLKQIATVPFNAIAGTLYTLRFRIVGTRMWARAWPTKQAEPSAWMITAVDTSIPSGSGGIRLLLDGGASATITIFTEFKAALP